MGKGRKITKPDSIRAMAVKETAQFFKCDKSYVHLVRRGLRENEEIKKYYNALYMRISKALAGKEAV